ncbi:hypothetical protein NEOLEDRAFT_483557 [Neolentinus lepideus HHB14362 ss-1]|uniref:Uncharacterized protein n=1 Tax=Neolentinus lepideus HHB14362 ss-1 TaxID=1314782 RepID=A0A165VM70_9AGAM|nr:hypothetical protein NEOLEDRAFT_483557 [Neolentinus lepideus HHB14362 ss-1]
MSSLVQCLHVSVLNLWPAQNQSLHLAPPHSSWSNTFQGTIPPQPKRLVNVNSRIVTINLKSCRSARLGLSKTVAKHARTCIQHQSQEEDSVKHIDANMEIIMGAEPNFRHCAYVHSK